MIGQQGGGGGGVSADDELQVVRRLGDQWNDEAAVKVSGPYVVDLGGQKAEPVSVAETSRCLQAVERCCTCSIRS